MIYDASQIAETTEEIKSSLKRAAKSMQDEKQ
jgi:hypothetical protein